MKQPITLALIIWLLYPSRLLAATCADLASYCSDFATMLNAEQSFNYINPEHDINERIDEYNTAEAKVRKAYREIGNVLYAYHITDSDYAAQVCMTICKENPDTSTLASRISAHLHQQQGPELR